MPQTSEPTAEPSDRDRAIEEAKVLLNAYHDRELNDDERRAVEDALKKYPELSQESSMIVGIKNILAQYEGVEPTADFKARLLARASEEAQPEPKRSVLVYALCVLIAILILALAFHLWP